MTLSRAHGLLIGINCYLERGNPRFPPPPELGGCLHDVRAMEVFLGERLRVREENLEILTAPVEKAGRLPTLAEIRAAWQRLAERSLPGDEAVIFFSGHGVRVRSPTSQGSRWQRFREGLVPFDATLGPSRVLADTELQALLCGLVERGVFVTLILDCCYSGGADRTRFWVKSWEEIRAEDEVSGLADAGQESFRGLGPDSSWQAMAQGYALLAACRANERAFEGEIDGVRRGLFAAALLGELALATPGTTYHQLSERVRGRLAAAPVTQQPELRGEAERPIFGRHLLAPSRADRAESVALGGRRAPLAEVSAQRLSPVRQHLARFRAVRRLGRRDPELAGKLELELLALEGDPRALRPRLRPLRAGLPTMRMGQWVALRLSNRSRHDLFFTVLDLDPGRGIRQIHPGDAGGDADLLNAGGASLLRFQACLDEGRAQGRDVIKVLFATSPMALRGLEQPPLADLDRQGFPAASIDFLWRPTPRPGVLTWVEQLLVRVVR